MPKVWEILLQGHPEALVKLAAFQWTNYGTKLDFLTEKEPSVKVEVSYPSLETIDKTMRQKPRGIVKG